MAGVLDDEDTEARPPDASLAAAPDAAMMAGPEARWRGSWRRPTPACLDGVVSTGHVTIPGNFPPHVFTGQEGSGPLARPGWPGT